MVVLKLLSAEQNLKFNMKLSIPEYSDTQEVRKRFSYLRKFFRNEENPELPSDQEDFLTCLFFPISGLDKTNEEINPVLELMFQEYPCKIDEVDIAIIYTCHLIKNFDSLDEVGKKEILGSIIWNENFDIHTIKRYDAEELIKIARNCLNNKLTSYTTKYLPKIRAKFAFLELLSAVHNANAIVHLISLCPRYLKSEIIQNWILHQQWLYRNSKDIPESNRAGKNLDLLFKKIKGDKRKRKDREYDYWRATLTYRRIIAAIKECRLQKEVARQDLCLVLESHSIHPEFHNRVLDGIHTPSAIAFDVIKKLKLAVSQKAFSDFQPHINKLIREHPEATNDYFIQNFLDNPIKFRANIEYLDIWNIFDY